jgi:hypothetical protein
MHMEHDRADSFGLDYRGKTAVVATHVVVEHIEQIREDLRDYMIETAPSRFRVSGFVLGKVVDVSIHGQYWVEFPWASAPVQVQAEHVLRVLLDDEGEPEIVMGLPKLV